MSQRGKLSLWTRQSMFYGKRVTTGTGSRAGRWWPTHHNKSTFIYKMSDIPLATVLEHNYVGIRFHHKLSWDPHINYICNKANRLLGFLKRNLHNAPSEILKNTSTNNQDSLSREAKKHKACSHNNKHATTTVSHLHEGSITQSLKSAWRNLRLTKRFHLETRGM